MFASPTKAALICCTGVLSFMSLAVHVAIARPPCHVEQITIQSNQGTRCVDCKKCPKGKGLSPQCGSYIKPGLKIECVDCPAGKSYSGGDDILACKPCSICGPNEETLRPCTPTQNAICGQCDEGFYREVTGDCKPCSRCCGRGDDEVTEECTNQGLPAKESCRYNLDTIKCARMDNTSTNTTMDFRGKSAPPDSEVGKVPKPGMHNLFVGILVGATVLALAACGSFILYCCVRPRCHKESSTLRNYLITCEERQGPVTPTVPRVTFASRSAGQHESPPKVVTGTICSVIH